MGTPARSRGEGRRYRTGSRGNEETLRDSLNRILWRLFPVFEHFGIHLAPVHYYSPIPDTRSLKRSPAKFEEEHPMFGIDMRAEKQLTLLKTIVLPYEREYLTVNGGQFGVDEKAMPSYAPLNALALYAIVRHFQPKLIIEVGSGFSTTVSACALVENQKKGVAAGRLIAIDPYPSTKLRRGLEGLSQVILSRVEEIPGAMFTELAANDILFIDSSHTVKIFGDVNYLFLNVLPQLQKGVLIHVHDIFFPMDYLPHHFFTRGNKQFWQEQYLLHAFLMFNREFQILLSNSYLHKKYQPELMHMFPWYHTERWPSSFWMVRTKGPDL